MKRNYKLQVPHTSHTESNQRNVKLRQKKISREYLERNRRHSMNLILQIMDCNLLINEDNFQRTCGKWEGKMT